MGSMVKADSERRELVRERRQARMERKQQRRDAREHKRSEISAPPPAVSAIQRAAQHEVDAALDRIVTEALERHDQITAEADVTHPASKAPAMPMIDARAVAGRRAGPAEPPTGSSTGHTGGSPCVTAQATPAARAGERRPRRERDIAAFRERRQQAADEARAEARERIARAGELACVADALAALGHPGARLWDAEFQELVRAIETDRIVEVGAAARRALWAISRDAAQFTPGEARSGSRTRGVRRLRDHRSPAAYSAAQRAADRPRAAPPARAPAPVLALTIVSRSRVRLAGIATGRSAIDTEITRPSKESSMHNPVPATHTLSERDDLRPAVLSSLARDARVATLCTRAIRLAITTVTDEVGRPLIGVFVPDGELL